MPELPEVETIVRSLNQQLSGRTVERISRVSRHLLKREPRLKQLTGETFRNFERRGKYIIANLESGGRLLVHLRMSGRFQVKPVDEAPDKHDHLEVYLQESGEKLVFRDVRKFGIMRFCDDHQDGELTSLGEEATTISARNLHHLFEQSRRQIKPFLLDQTKIAGLGNIYVDESLYRARIHPEEITSNLSASAVKTLVSSIRFVLRQAIRNLGTTFDSYRSPDGKRGNQYQYLKVYDNAGEKCRRCNSKIRKVRVGGRGTHFCPRCQRLKSRKRS